MPRKRADTSQAAPGHGDAPNATGAIDAGAKDRSMSAITIRPTPPQIFVDSFHAPSTNGAAIGNHGVVSSSSSSPALSPSVRRRRSEGADGVDDVRPRRRSFDAAAVSDASDDEERFQSMHGIESLNQLAEARRQRQEHHRGQDQRQQQQQSRVDRRSTKKSKQRTESEANSVFYLEEDEDDRYKNLKNTNSSSNNSSSNNSGVNEDGIGSKDEAKLLKISATLSLCTLSRPLSFLSFGQRQSFVKHAAQLTLSNRSLFFYAKSARQMRGDFALNRILVVENVDDMQVARNRLTFQIVYSTLPKFPSSRNATHPTSPSTPRPRRLYVRASTQAEKKEWVDALRRAATEEGAGFQQRFHPGIWLRWLGKWSCCEIVDQDLEGCQATWLYRHQDYDDYDYYDATTYHGVENPWLLNGQPPNKTETNFDFLVAANQEAEEKTAPKPKTTPTTPPTPTAGKHRKESGHSLASSRSRGDSFLSSGSPPALPPHRPPSNKEIDFVRGMVHVHGSSTLTYPGMRGFAFQVPEDTSRFGSEEFYTYPDLELQEKAGEWYFPTLTRVAAEALLEKDTRPGCFLVRDSATNPNCFTLSVYDPTTDATKRFYHYLIRKGNDGEGYFYGDPRSSERFNTLKEIVEALMDPKGQFNISASLTCWPTTRVATQMTEYEYYSEPAPVGDSLLDWETCDWYFGSMTRRDAEKLVRSDGEDGCFIVRQSELSEGVYVVTLLHKPTSKMGGSVRHYRIQETDDDKFFLADREKAFPTVAELVDSHLLFSAGLVTRLTHIPRKGELEEADEGLEDRFNSFDIPRQILNRGKSAVEAFKRAATGGNKRTNRLRIMLVGKHRVGKTSLKKSLLGECFDLKEQRTEGIDTKNRFEISIDTAIDWKVQREVKSVVCQRQYDREIARRWVSTLQQHLESRTDAEEMSKPAKGKKTTFTVSKVEEDKFQVNDLDEVYEGLDKTEDKAARIESVSSAAKSTTTSPTSTTTESLDECDARLDSSTVDQPESVEGLDAFADIDPTRLTVRRGSMKERRPAFALSLEIPDQIQKFASEIFNEETYENETKPDNLVMNIWDFGGEYLYYSTHQMFLTPFAVYVVAFDLNDELVAEEDDIDDEATYSRVPVYSTQEDKPLLNLDFVNFWLNSIHYYADRESETETDAMADVDRVAMPPVIIVGTHRESLADEENGKLGKVKAKFKVIKDSIANKPFTKHVVSKFYAVENSIADDDEVLDLKRKIEEIARQERFVQTNPVSWIKIESSLAALVEQGIHYLPLDTVRQLAYENDCRDESEFFTMLQYFHDIGVVLFFGKEGRSTHHLGKMVVLNPQWLVDALKQILTVGINQVPQWLSVSWKKFEKRGLLDKGLLDFLWKRSFDSEEQVFLLDLMEKFDLLCAKRSLLPGSRSMVANTPVDAYFVPLRLWKKTDDLRPIKCSAMTSFYLDFDGFLPEGLFHRLLTRVIRWAQERGDADPKIGFHQGLFMLDVRHDLFLQMAPLQFAKIHVTVTTLPVHGEEEEDGQATSDLKRISPQLIIEVRHFIEMALQDIQNVWGRKTPFHAQVPCLVCNKDEQLQGHFLDLDSFMGRTDGNDFMRCHPTRKLFKIKPVLDQFFEKENANLPPLVDADTLDVYISYNWQQKEKVLSLATSLSKAGLSVVMDQGQFGGAFARRNSINDILVHAKVVLCCLSTQYCVSTECETDASLIASFAKPTVPVLLESLGGDDPSTTRLINLTSLSGENASRCARWQADVAAEKEFKRMVDGIAEFVKSGEPKATSCGGDSTNSSMPLAKIGLLISHSIFPGEFPREYLEKKHVMTNKSISTEQIIKLATKAIGMEWEVLAYLLEFTKPEIDHFQLDYPHKTKERTIQMLFQWRQRAVDSSVPFLVKKLREAGVDRQYFEFLVVDHEI